MRSGRARVRSSDARNRKRCEALRIARQTAEGGWRRERWRRDQLRRVSSTSRGVAVGLTAMLSASIVSGFAPPPSATARR